MNSSQQLLEDLESIKNVLMARATGERANESKYQRLRNRLTTNALVKDKLPRFVRTCGTLGEFWTIIQEQSRTYAKRRRYIGEQFEEVLTFLEQQATTPGDEPITTMLDKLDAPHVSAAWQKALERRASDPTGAITSARTLIETVLKHILDEQQIAYSETDDLPKLYRLTADSLNLSPSQHTEEEFRQILGGCDNVVEGLNAICHSETDGMGKGAVRPVPRHAELAVNLAGTMATFLLATWESKHK